MRWLSLGLLVLALLAAKDAYAAHWLRLGHNNMDVTYIDVDSEKSQDGYRLVWTMTVFNEPRSVHGKVYRSEAILSYIDCFRKEIAAKSVVYYSRSDGHGDVVAQDDDLHMDFRPVTPGSFGDVLIKRECL